MSIDYDLQDAAEKLRNLIASVNTGPWVATPDVLVGGFAVARAPMESPEGPYLADFVDEADARYIAAMHPGVGAVLADWLGCLSALDPSERGGERCAWCGGDHAADMARAISGVTS